MQGMIDQMLAMLEMKRYRRWIAIAFCWFSMLALLLPMRVASFAYPYLIGWVVLVLFSSSVRRLRLWLVGGLASAAFLAIATWSGLPIDAALLLTVAAIFISLLIAKALGDADEALDKPLRLRTNQISTKLRSVRSARSSLQAELQRGRDHHRPLSVLAISAADFGGADQDAMASLLSKEMRAYDRVCVRDDHFVLLLPETDAEKTMQFVVRLRTATRKKLGLELDIGQSSFPAQVTLDGLLEHAESEMRVSDQPTLDSAVESTQRVGSWSG
jgi:hypothetical protein